MQILIYGAFPLKQISYLIIIHKNSIKLEQVIQVGGEQIDLYDQQCRAIIIIIHRLMKKQGKRLNALAPKGEQVVISLTEVTEPSLTARNQIRCQFLEREKVQSQTYIKDLENTIAINKEIISELLSKDSSGHKNKKLIEKLNIENASLQAQLKKVIRERNDNQGKLLISEQIIEDYKTKEQEQLNEHREKQAELVDQLNRKEFILQSFERKYNKALVVLKRFSHKDQEIRQALKELNADLLPDKKISNVVEENENFERQLAEKSAKIVELETRLGEMAEANNRLETLLEDYKYRDLGSGKQKRQLTQAKTTVNTYPEETLDKERIMLLEDELEKIQTKSTNLYKLNVRLSEALEAANSKINVLKKYIPRERGPNKSSLDVCTLNSARGPSRKRSTRGLFNEVLAREPFAIPPRSARGPAPIDIFGAIPPTEFALVEQSPRHALERMNSGTEPQDDKAAIPEEKLEADKSFGQLSSIKDEHGVNLSESDDEDLKNLSKDGDDKNYPREIVATDEKRKQGGKKSANSQESGELVFNKQCFQYGAIYWASHQQQQVNQEQKFYNIIDRVIWKFITIIMLL
eukprot:TRINITY_DN64310_c1_g1_i1.p1 TRINITY_DN64310_c1_g1~~TRINITY_DN64310_c1_g1_i1.p1  ORF type:complete len:578 (-),score=50.72 TRINITY_DN64310_c1_g1_i1:1724-3457(-)